MWWFHKIGLPPSHHHFERWDLPVHKNQPFLETSMTMEPPPIFLIVFCCPIFNVSNPLARPIRLAPVATGSAGWSMEISSVTYEIPSKYCIVFNLFTSFLDGMIYLCNRLFTSTFTNIWNTFILLNIVILLMLSNYLLLFRDEHDEHDEHASIPVSFFVMNNSHKIINHPRFRWYELYLMVFFNDPFPSVKQFRGEQNNG